MVKYIKEGYIDSSFLIIKRLLNLLEADCSYTSIKNCVIKYNSYPYISLQDLSLILRNEFGINNILEKSLPDTIESLPSIHFLNIKEGAFILVTAFDNNKVSFIHPYIGESEMDAEAFFSYSAGFNLKIDNRAKPQFTIEGDDIHIKSEKESEQTFREKYIKYIDHFLTDEECNTLKSCIDDFGKFRFSNSDDQKKESQINLSMGLSKDDANLKRISDKIISGVQVLTDKPYECIEEPMLIRYLENQRNSLHYDVLDEAAGKYLYSALIYLNDDFRGAETAFPQAGIKIKPKKGNLLLFRSFDDNMKIIDCSVHAGLPVIEGAKYTCNVWVTN